MGVKLANRNKGIFIYGISGEKAGKIEMLSERLELSCNRIPKGAGSEKIRNIVEGKPLKSMQSDAGITSEVLIFNSIKDEELDVFLKEYKNAGIEPVGLKAVVTADNSGWTLDELIRELIKERAAIAFKRI